MKLTKITALLWLIICVLITGCGADSDEQSQADVPVQTALPAQPDEAERTVQLNKTKLTLHVGDSFQLKAVGASAADVKWSSSNKKVASVSSDGVIKAKKKGTVKISAKAYGKSYTCKVKIAPAKKQKIATPSYDFRNPSYLTEHYKKHGIEMGFESEDDYLRAANAVINNPAALHKLESDDDDDLFFIEATNEFVVLSQDGYIRTYFICSGRDYFDRQ